MAAALGFGDHAPLLVQSEEHARWRWVTLDFFDEIFDHPHVIGDCHLDVLLEEDDIVCGKHEGCFMTSSW